MIPQMEPRKYYEADIKDELLNTDHILGDVGEHIVRFEKAICKGRTITDCLIFSTVRGIIGIEIKTEYDSISRLPAQMKNYAKVCDEVYVLCHDKHIEKVEEVLTGYPYVGIMAYQIFEDTFVAGLYMAPSHNPKQSLEVAFDMLWKVEIEKLLRECKTLFHIHDIPEGTLNGSQIDACIQLITARSGYSSSKLGKKRLIHNLISILGEDIGRTVLVRCFRQGVYTDDIIRYEDFYKN